MAGAGPEPRPGLIRDFEAASAEIFSKSVDTAALGFLFVPGEPPVHSWGQRAPLDPTGTPDGRARADFSIFGWDFHGFRAFGGGPMSCRLYSVFPHFGQTFIQIKKIMWLNSISRALREQLR